MNYSVQTIVGQLLNDERAKGILEKHIPGSTSHPQLHQVLHMTLMEVSQFPQAKLSQATLTEILRDLNEGTEGDTNKQ